MDNRLCLELSGDSLRWALVSRELVLLEQGSLAFGAASADEACALLARVVGEHGASCAGVGVCVPGTLGTGALDGVVCTESPHCLDGVALGAELSFATSLPVTVEAAGKAYALGEYAAGALDDCGLGVVLTLDERVAAGIVSGGRLVGGAHGFAGEVGYMRRAPFEGLQRPEDELSGSCGADALKQAVLAAKGMLDMGDVGCQDVFEWVMRGDADALRGLHEYAKRLCMWIVNLQCVVDPERFVLTGEVGVRQALVEALQTIMRSTMAEPAFKQVPRPSVAAGRLGGDAGLVGVAYLSHGRR